MGRLVASVVTTLSCPGTTGLAVDSGLVCASGSVVDTGIVFAGFKSGRSAQILVRKTFTCDGGGTFFVKIQVHLDFETSTETFTWVVTGGTGSPANILATF